MKTNKKLQKYVNDNLSEYENDVFLEKLKSSVPEDKRVKYSGKSRKVVFASITVAVILVSVCLGVFLGRPWITESGETPAEKTQIDYNVAFAGSYGQKDMAFGAQYATTKIESDLRVKIDTLDELIAVSNENGFPFFDKKAEGYDSELGKRIRKYDEEFFSEKSLILVFRLGVQGRSERVVGLHVRGDSYVVTLSTLVYDDYWVDFVGGSRHSFANILEIDKNDEIYARKIEVETVSNGRLYPTLEVTFRLGMISEEEVRSIIYYFNNGKEYVDGKLAETDYTPIPLEPKELSEDTLRAIKSTLIDAFFYSGEPLNANAQTSVMNISLKYLGTYNGYVAVYYYVGTMGIIGGYSETVAGYTYNSGGMLPILLWEAP